MEIIIVWFFPIALAVDLGSVRGLPVDRDRLVVHHWSTVNHLLRYFIEGWKLSSVKIKSTKRMAHWLTFGNPLVVGGNLCVNSRKIRKSASASEGRYAHEEPTVSIQPCNQRTTRVTLAKNIKNIHHENNLVRRRWRACAIKAFMARRTYDFVQEMTKLQVHLFFRLLKPFFFKTRRIKVLVIVLQANCKMGQVMPLIYAQYLC